MRLLHCRWKNFFYLELLFSEEIFWMHMKGRSWKAEKERDAFAQWSAFFAFCSLPIKPKTTNWTNWKFIRVWCDDTLLLLHQQEQVNAKPLCRPGKKFICCVLPRSHSWCGGFLRFEHLKHPTNFVSLHSLSWTPSWKASILVKRKTKSIQYRGRYRMLKK